MFGARPTGCWRCCARLGGRRPRSEATGLCWTGSPVLAERGLETVSERVCVEFVEDETGVRLESLREPVTDRRVRAVRRAVVLMVDVLAGRAVDG